MFKRKKMKKLSSVLLFLSIVVLGACSSDDDNDVQLSFANKLTTANTTFTSASTNLKGYYYYDTFTDDGGLVSFYSYYSFYGSTRYYSGFFYSNVTDRTTTNSFAPIATGGNSTYVAVYPSDYTPAIMAIKSPNEYSFKGCYITNSVYAYNCMTTDKMAPATKFTKGSWYKVTAEGFTSADKSVGTTSIYLANYTSDSDKPVSSWVWFDLSKLGNAAYVKLTVSSSDTGNSYGMNTSANFCIDKVALRKE